MSKKQLNVAIAENIFEKAKDKCKENNISMAWLIENMLAMFVSGKITAQKTVVIEIKADEKE